MSRLYHFEQSDDPVADEIKFHERNFVRALHKRQRGLVVPGDGIDHKLADLGKALAVAYFVDAAGLVEQVREMLRALREARNSGSSSNNEALLARDLVLQDYRDAATRVRNIRWAQGHVDAACAAAAADFEFGLATAAQALAVLKATMGSLVADFGAGAAAAAGRAVLDDSDRIMDYVVEMVGAMEF